MQCTSRGNPASGGFRSTRGWKRTGAKTAERKQLCRFPEPFGGYGDAAPNYLLRSRSETHSVRTEANSSAYPTFVSTNSSTSVQCAPLSVDISNRARILSGETKL